MQAVVWGGRLPSRRRAITGGLSALGIGEGGGFAAGTCAAEPACNPGAEAGTRMQCSPATLAAARVRCCRWMAAGWPGV